MKIAIIIGSLGLFCLANSAGLPIFKTEQTTVYHNGDDASYRYGAPRSYQRDAQAEIVIDNFSHLMWEDNSSQTFNGSYSQALSHCENLAAANYEDWRLPTYQEILTLKHAYADLSSNRPIDNIFLTPDIDTQNDYFWTSTLPNPNECSYCRKTVHFAVMDDWYTFIEGMNSGSRFTICVRDNLNLRFSDYIRDNDTETVTATAGYIIRENGETITNVYSKLIWQDDDIGENNDSNWTSAIDYCENLNLAGKNNWRLPNINELSSILDDTQYPAISNVFQNTQNTDYLSSTITGSSSEPNGVYMLSFEDGYRGVMTLSYANQNIHSVRCVSDGNKSVNSIADYNLGYADGNNSGWHEGNASGYYEGNTTGWYDGNFTGYTDGNTSGFNLGFSDGNTSGYNQGHTIGYSAGDSDGYDRGYPIGFTDGNDTGYGLGRSDAIDDCKAHPEGCGIKPKAVIVPMF